jgi:hypothetical protein
MEELLKVAHIKENLQRQIAELKAKLAEPTP